MDFLKVYGTPAAIGILGGLIIQLISMGLSKKKITVDDNATLRKDLMTERLGLVAEIQNLSKRCADYEKELVEAHTEILELKARLREIQHDDSLDS